MRRIRHLSNVSYVVKIGQKIRQILTLCDQGNIVLERTWHKQSTPRFEINAHVKFNTDQMNGLQVLAQLDDRGDVKASASPVFMLYRVDQGSWNETLINDFTPVELAHGSWACTIDQSELGANELSGLEVYSIEIYFNRKRRTFKKKLWFNDLGSFDSIWRIKRAIEQHEILKMD